MRLWRYMKQEVVFAVLLIVLIVACVFASSCGNDMCGCPFGMVCAVGRDGKMTCAPAPRQVASSDEEATP